MADAQLNAEPRELRGKKVRFLRRQGLLPANLYGRREESVAVQIPTHELIELVRHGGARHYFDLAVTGQSTQPVVIQRIDRDPVSRQVLHVDFLRVSLTEVITVTVALTFVGEAPAVRDQGGVVIHGLNSVTVSALPGDVPDSFEIDLSSLAEIDAALHVSDLRPPNGVTILTDPTQLVAKVEAPRLAAEEEEAAVAEEGAEAAEGAEEAAPAEDND